MGDRGRRQQEQSAQENKLQIAVRYPLPVGVGQRRQAHLEKAREQLSTGATAIGSGKALSVNVGQWYDTHFELVGTSLEGCVGDVCVSGTDASIASGSVAVGTVNTSARFDDVRVAAP